MTELCNAVHLLQVPQDINKEAAEAIARAARDMHGALIAGGISAWFGSQMVINIGGITGVIPMTGLTLPFFSARAAFSGELTSQASQAIKEAAE